jgi:hypothetical protein
MTCGLRLNLANPGMHARTNEANRADAASTGRPFSSCATEAQQRVRWKGDFAWSISAASALSLSSRPWLGAPGRQYGLAGGPGSCRHNWSLDLGVSTKVLDRGPQTRYPPT